VTRGDKAFDVHANTYRVDADVVACIEHRRYVRESGRLTYASGTTIHPDGGGRIINWPEQHYQNGVAKNNATNGNFKRLVRIMKNLRNYMAEEGRRAADPISSYLTECLIWNVPENGFMHTSYSNDVRYALAHLYNDTRTDEPCSEWGEINELKYLFRSSQPWNRAEVHRFLDAAWNFLDLG
jgi:hypothetical protein